MRLKKIVAEVTDSKPLCPHVKLARKQIKMHVCICMYVLCTYVYRVFHDLRTLLQEVISQVFVIKKVHTNTCPVLDGYGVMTA